MSFLANLRSGGAHDPFRRSRSRATTVRSQRVRRASAGAAVAVLLGGALLTLPGSATPVAANEGAAIARVSLWVRHAAHEAYLDLVKDLGHGAALAGRRKTLTDADFVAARDDVRYRIAVDQFKIGQAQTFLKGLDVLRDEWFHLYGGDPASPILGPSKLTAEQMATFVQSTHAHVRTTIPLITVARMFLEEGEREGVRGDVAFAQAIKETGTFSSSDVKLNNFAGLGHCSACPRGDAFLTARAGIRAQIQLLRWLADPTLHSISDFAAQPATVPAHFLHNGHSRATWASLGGLWAPNPQYGISVYATYLSMHAFAVAHAHTSR